MRTIHHVKYVYFFGLGKAEGNGEMKEILGGKGAGLAEMTRIGLPVPAGFTISTECCDYYLKHNHKHPSGLRSEVETNLARLERAGARCLVELVGSLGEGVGLEVQRSDVLIVVHATSLEFGPAGQGGLIVWVVNATCRILKIWLELALYELPEVWREKIIAAIAPGGG